MKLWLFLMSSLMSITALSQTKNDVTGNWKVIQVLIPAEIKKNKEASMYMEKAFHEARFQFNSNGSCKVNTSEKELQVNNGKWEYNEKEKSVSITGKDINGYTGLLIKLSVSTKNSKWYFDLYETPIALEVQKVTGTN